MNLSRNWLNEFVDLHDITDKQFNDEMTLSGSKVETIERLDESLKNVVAGKILSMEKHPDSDHMWVCQLDVGREEPVQIVTGAWNIHIGDLVPAALHKSVLPGGVKIEKGKLRGVPSNGMLCSLKELGLTAEHDFPYAVITPAALLNDYHPIDPAKPSIPADIKPGDKVFGPVAAAKVLECAPQGDGTFHTCLDLGGATACPDTVCSNLHEGDLVAYNTKSDSICTLADLHAEQKEFPHCIADGIFVLHEDDVKPGDDIAKVIGYDDSVVEFEITPNRPDCLSVIGLAREASATFKRPLKLHTPEVKGCGGSIAELVDIEIEDGELCPRYTARMVKNVKIAPSPKWMRERLRNSGVRPINNIVDITNYVMLEYGQPMHAFDYRYVKGGKIVVRRAGEDKTLTTLDGNVRNLQPDMLVIADETKPVGLAGVMGGENSEIVDDTVDVVFESANFLGSSIRKTALALGMRTDASAKFEKDIDPMLTVPAVNRACELVEMLGAGEVMDGMIDVLNYVPQPVTVKLEPERINALLGTDIPEADMIEYLRREEVPVVDGMIQVPSWRPDLRVMADIAEEVARYYGYNNIETTLMRGATTMGGYSDAQKLENAAGAAARAMGYSEIITYSFVSPASFDAIRIPADSPLRRTVKLVNPLGEDTSIMRTVILPSMLDILSRNFAFKNKGVKLYEIGKIYLPKDGEKLPDEPKRMIFGTYGEHENFFTLKGEIDAILDQLNVHPATYIADTKNPSYHPGRCADIVIDGKKMGVIGQIHPLVAETYGIGGEVYVAELDFTGLQAVLAPERVFHSLPKFPTVSRDLALVCEESMTVGMLEACIKKAGGKLLRSVQLFDIYRGPGIAPGEKSIAFSLELRADDRTLTDEDTTGVMNAVLEKLKNDLGVSLR